MNSVHQLLHTIWWSHYKTHHLPDNKFSMLNAFYFGVLNHIGENLIRQFLFCLIKLFFGWFSCSIHYVLFVLSVVCDQTVHSFNPYTITFLNPLLDNFLRLNLSHILTTGAKLVVIPVWRCIKFKMFIDQITKVKLGIFFCLTLTIGKRHLKRISLQTSNSPTSKKDERKQSIHRYMDILGENK